MAAATIIIISLSIITKIKGETSLNCLNIDEIAGDVAREEMFRKMGIHPFPPDDS